MFQRDCLLFPVASAMLLPQLLRARNKLYLLLLPILLAWVYMSWQIILFGAEWSPQSNERRRWFEAAAPRIPAETKVGYAEINWASIPGHYCGIICVPTLIIWREGKVVDQLIECFSREDLDGKLQSYIS